MVNVEVKILYAMGCESGIKEGENNYNKVHTKEALEKYNFNSAGSNIVYPIKSTYFKPMITVHLGYLIGKGFFLVLPII